MNIARLYVLHQEKINNTRRQRNRYETCFRLRFGLSSVDIQPQFLETLSYIYGSSLGFGYDATNERPLMMSSMN